MSCHGEKKEKGKFHVGQNLRNDLPKSRTAEQWAGALNVVRSHEMPPEEELQPDPDQAGTFADWVAKALLRAEQAK